MSLHLFSFFHLNLMFSSIEEEARPEVIRRCYWPLLRLAVGDGGPLGIELTGYTLEIIQSLDPDWVTELKRLIASGRVELIGSGYAQIVGPLVPAAVNRANQQLGRQIYLDLLGIVPDLALVNEQAWSAGMVEHYKDASYQAVLMEWDNPAAGHPEWAAEWRYYPQRAQGPGTVDLPVIWNQSIAFQKFQRYAHGELELEEMLEYLQQRIGAEDRTWALYGNDVEIFDYRPGRFQTEAELTGNEWERIGALYRALRTDDHFRLVRPSAVLSFLDRPQAGQRLRLESAKQPVPVKKQIKYNIIRWAVTGRDDFDLNSRCHRLLAALEDMSTPGAGDWKELCYLWSSDFRTHITEHRWQALQQRLAAAESRLVRPSMVSDRGDAPIIAVESGRIGAFDISRTDRLVVVSTAVLRMSLNSRRGLALEALQQPGDCAPLVGTLPHGFFDDIAFGADYYTGHTVFEAPGHHKVTDLSRVQPEVRLLPDGRLGVSAQINMAFGGLNKTWVLAADEAAVDLIYRFQWLKCPRGTFRIGHVTLHPGSFTADTLYFRTLNGGTEPEHFACAGAEINHLTPVSSLISASQGLGMTGGWIECGDNRRTLRISTNPADGCITAHVQYAPLGNRFFFRLVFSLQEIDDTSAQVPARTSLRDRILRFRFQFSENKR